MTHKLPPCAAVPEVRCHFTVVWPGPQVPDAWFYVGNLNVSIPHLSWHPQFVMHAVLPFKKIM